MKQNGRSSRARSTSNENFRLQLDGEHTKFDQKIQYGQFARDQEDV